MIFDDKNHSMNPTTGCHGEIRRKQKKKKIPNNGPSYKYER